MDKIYDLLGMNNFMKYGFTHNLLFKYFGYKEIEQKDEKQIHFATLLYCDRLKKEFTEPPSYNYE